MNNLGHSDRGYSDRVKIRCKRDVHSGMNPGGTNGMKPTQGEKSG